MSDGSIPDWHITNPDHTPFEDDDEDFDEEDDDYEDDDEDDDDDYDYSLLGEL